MFKNLLTKKKNFLLRFLVPSASPIMDGIITFHDFINYFLVVIFTFVAWFLYRIVKYYMVFLDDSELVIWNRRRLKHIAKRPFYPQIVQNTFLEIVWTIVPIGILLIIMVPSFTLLYAQNEILIPQLTLKMTGHQWYWNAEYHFNVLLRK